MIVSRHNQDKPLMLNGMINIIANFMLTPNLLSTTGGCKRGYILGQ